MNQTIKFWFLQIEDFPGFTRNTFEVAMNMSDAIAKSAFKHKVAEIKISMLPTPLKNGRNSMRLRNLI